MNKTICRQRRARPRALTSLTLTLAPGAALAAAPDFSLTATLVPLYWPVALGAVLALAAGGAAALGLRLRRARALARENAEALRAENHKLFRQQQSASNELAAQQRLMSGARETIARQQQEKSDTLAVVGHRLRQPLDALQATLNLLARSARDESAELTAIARRQLHSAQQMLEQVQHIGELETVELTEPQTPPRQKPAPLSILLVESGEHDSLYTALEIRGHRVQRESNGIEGASAALQNSFDLMLIDTHLPLIDGVEATLKIRQDGGELPIFALVSGLRRGDQERYRARGFTGVLARPVAEYQLEQLLNWSDRRTRKRSGAREQRATRLLNAATLGRQRETLGSRAFADLLSDRVATLPRRTTALTSALTGRHWPDAARIAPALAASAAEIGLEAAAARLRALSARLAIDSEREYCRHQRTEILNLMRESIEQLKSWRERNVPLERA